MAARVRARVALTIETRAFGSKLVFNPRKAEFAGWNRTCFTVRIPPQRARHRSCGLAAIRAAETARVGRRGAIVFGARVPPYRASDYPPSRRVVRLKN